jgi:multidrug efflux pump subunit AcrB
MDQIDLQVAAGEDRYHAIIGATVFRFRPIILTAAATILTLFVLPCMVAAWYRVKAA